MAFEWDAEPERVLEQVGQEYADAIHAAVFQLAQRYAPEIEAHMKRTAPWQDLTGNARQTLFTEVEHVAGVMTEIILSHGVTYGVFLELKNSGFFAVIGPSLDTYAPKIWADVQELVR